MQCAFRVPCRVNVIINVLANNHNNYYFYFIRFPTLLLFFFFSFMGSLLSSVCRARPAFFLDTTLQFVEHGLPFF